jgi:antitoxin component of MazEF toxin-antitoxin module
MTVAKKLTRHGNSLAIVIEKPILELLGIDSETWLQISTPDGSSIMITPVKDETQKKRLDASLDKINAKYGNALKRLAE